MHRERLRRRRSRGRAAARRSPADSPSRRARCSRPVRVGRLALGRLAALEIDDDRVAVGRRRGLRPARSAPRARAAAPAPRSTASSSTRLDGRAQRERRVVARLEGRHRVERRREGQRLAFLDRDVADVGRVDRLDAALAQRLVDRARDEIVRDVVEDLILEALLDDAGRRLARPEAGDRAPCASSRARRGRFPRRPRRSGFRRSGSCASR